MRFIVQIPRLATPSEDEVSACWRAYREYIASLHEKLPPGALAYATSEWHSNYQHPMSPHDAWLERMTIDEPATGSRGETRSIKIVIELLGSYHNGLIRFTYPSVRSYSFWCPDEYEMLPHNVGHGDWLADEVRLSDAGFVIHDVLLSRGAEWRIEASDLQYEWVPTSATP